MKIKLYNFSRYSNDILKKACEYAYRVNNCRGEVVVKVTRGGYRTRSYAHNYYAVYKHFLSARSYTKSSNYTKLKEGSVYCDGLVVLKPNKSYRDSLENAQYLMNTIIHEFKHIADFQNKEYFGQYDRKWAERPHECRAVNFTKEIEQRLDQKYQNLIIDLAIEKEEKNI